MPLPNNWFTLERLHRAAASGSLAEVQSLVGDGCPLDVFDSEHYTPLHYAVEGEHYKTAEWLLEQGANVNARDEVNNEETALSLAVQRDYPEMVELLLRYGADADIGGWMGHTARTRAMRRRDEEGLKIAALLEKYRP